MDESWTNWLCDLEIDGRSFMNQCDAINAVDASFASHDLAALLQEEENLQQCLSTDYSYCSYATSFHTENASNTSNSCVDENCLERPAKLVKTCSASISANNQQHFLQNPASSPSSYMLSFDNVNPPPTNNAQLNGGTVDYVSASKPKEKVVSSLKSSRGSLENKQNEVSRGSQEGKKTNSASRSPSYAQYHIMAERLRREKITQQFIALSALIPGLKKTDKSSVLGDAIKYVKQLQEQVKLLEDQTKRKSVESVVFVKKSQLSAEEDVSDSSSNSCGENPVDPSKSNRSLPEVEARVSKKDVLIRIHCEKQKGVLMNILREIENLNLTVINSSVLPFGTSIVDITVIAQMEDEFSWSVRELARNLRVALSQFI